MFIKISTLLNHKGLFSVGLAMRILMTETYGYVMENSRRACNSIPCGSASVCVKIIQLLS